MRLPPPDISRWNAALEEVDAWMAGEPTLQRATGTVLHQLLQAWRDNDLVKGPPEEAFDPAAHFGLLLNHQFQIFVVEHDWAGAFATSNVFGQIGDQFQFRQPYEHCCFEYLVSGKRVCFVVHFDGAYFRLALFVRLKVGWLQPPLNPRVTNWPRMPELRALVGRQHQAIMVALDAALAETTIVRAPHQLNRAREKRGAPPVFDYHVVNLAHRSRPATLPPEQETNHNGVRLHFRRGHWRHFEAFKTWINWTLVGDPDLGFIDKHYRL
jgi:hypothetical protein